ncbi:hypothetical protein [uncultured Polaribacter sp.]|uniref:hypothetical protein n=1 Tax=uncultured Polaribacter sp. TaxID=174711 RepID=UPI0030DD017B|tara:strand:- start:23 stop:202 length:180 start_codon:yes stop_codon:yes gene_type:complete
MNNPFKQIFQFYEVPGTLKQKVLDDINSIKSTIHITDLFLLKYPSNFIDIINKKIKKDR